MITLFTSTVIISPPNMTNAVGEMWNTAQPLFESLWPFILFIIGIGFVFAVLRWVVSIFRGSRRKKWLNDLHSHGFDIDDVDPWNRGGPGTFDE